MLAAFAEAGGLVLAGDLDRDRDRLRDPDRLRERDLLRERDRLPERERLELRERERDRERDEDERDRDLDLLACFPLLRGLGDRLLARSRLRLLLRLLALRRAWGLGERLRPPCACAG